MINRSNKRAPVTGGSRGIGAATGSMPAEGGADVVLGHHSRRDDAERAAKGAMLAFVKSWAPEPAGRHLTGEIVNLNGGSVVGG